MHKLCCIADAILSHKICHQKWPYVTKKSLGDLKILNSLQLDLRDERENLFFSEVHWRPLAILILKFKNIFEPIPSQTLRALICGSNRFDSDISPDLLD